MHLVTLRRELLGSFAGAKILGPKLYMRHISNCVSPPMISPALLKAEPVCIDWNSRLPVFAKEEFLSAVGDEYGWLGGFDDSKALRCILPYTIVRKAGLRMVRFRVETIPWGLGLSVLEEKSFLNSVVQYFRNVRADVIIPASTNAIFRTYPDCAIAAPYGSYAIALTRPEEELWRAFNSSHRRNIRSAQKNGVRVRDALEQTTEAHAIIRETFKKSSMTFMRLQEFERMVQGLQNHVNLFVAESQGKIQSCAVISFSHYGAYYMYGGSIPDPVPGAMHLLHWEAACFYRQRGVSQYDFHGARIAPAPGSKAAGLAAFKQRFGAQLQEGYIWKCRLSPIKSVVYSLGVRCLRGGDIVDQEAHKLPRSAHHYEGKAWRP